MIRSLILVTGAGGKTGRAIVKALSKAGTVCAFVKGEEHVPVAKALGAEKVVVGDLRDEARIRSAMEGARAVYHISPNMSPDEIAISKSVIEEARRAGVEHFVYHSVLHPHVEKMPHHWQKLRVEEMIFESGLPFTILQPAPYMQNFRAIWQSIVENGVLRVPYSVDARFSFLELQDLGEVVRTVLTEPGHLHAVYELASTEPMSHVDVAAVFERVLRRPVQAQREETGDWKRRSSAPPGDYAVESLIKMFEYYDQWGLAGNSNVLRGLLRRDPTSLEAFIERELAERTTID